MWKGPKYDPALVYVLEFTTCLVLRDAETTLAHGKVLAEALTTIVRNAARLHPLVVSRSIYYMFSLLEHSHEHSFLRAPLALHSVAALDKTLLDKSALPVAKSLSKCIKRTSALRSEIINSPDLWIVLRCLLHNRDAVTDVFGILGAITSEPITNVTADNYVAVVSLLNEFASEANIGAAYEQRQDISARRGKLQKKSADYPGVEVVSRGTKALTMIYSLHTRVPDLITQSHLEKNEAWTAYWLPIFQSLSTQCTNPCREIRNSSLGLLRQSLLGPEVTSDSSHGEWTAIFGDVLFPLIGRLLKPEVFQADLRGMSDTRVQAATLLCKIFLHYLVMLSEWAGMLDLWLRILDIMDRLMNSGQGDHLVFPTPLPPPFPPFPSLILKKKKTGRSRSGIPQEYPPGHGERWVPGTALVCHTGGQVAAVGADVETAGTIPAGSQGGAVSGVARTRSCSGGETGRKVGKDGGGKNGGKDGGGKDGGKDGGCAIGGCRLIVA